MNDEEQPEEPCTCSICASKIDKGKGRATEPTERTPLLGPTPAILDNAVAPTNSSGQRDLRSKLTTVFLVSLCVCICGFAAAALLAWSYASRASHLRPDDIIKNNLVFRGPDRINVVNVTKDGVVWLDVHGKVGLDAGSVIGVDTNEHDGLFRDIWKAIGRWGVRTLDSVSVNLTSITITPVYDPKTALVTVDIPPIELPLTVDPPNDASWLTPVSKRVRVQLSANNTFILQFCKTLAVWTSSASRKEKTTNGIT